MRLTVFYTPATILPGTVSADDVFIVIDVIRATTTLTVMLDRGAARMLVASTIDEAREAAQKIPGSYLCGERRVKPVPGFDFGNSPSQFAQFDLSGRTMILTTTNGTRAFYACPEDSMRLAGCFYNARAVTERALTLALQRGGNLNIVCSGEYNYFALDDSVCAGYFALELQRQHAELADKKLDGFPSLSSHESAYAAIALYRAFTPPILVDHCESARTVIEAGLLDDPPFCMQFDGSTSVPVVLGKDEVTGLLTLGKE